MGQTLLFYTPVILAGSECLQVSATVYDPWSPPRDVREAVIGFMERGEEGPLLALSTRDRVLSYTIMYGGVLLFYTCGPVAPISRIYRRASIRLRRAEGLGPAKSRLSDHDILGAWALMFSGDFEGGMRALEGVLVWPEGFAWELGGDGELSPIGVTYLKEGGPA